MTRRLEFLDEALEEAEEAARWYAERSPSAAAALIDELERAEAEIQRTPDTWPHFDHHTHRFLLRRFPYSVIYRVEIHRVLVIAVAHAHRRPGYWRDRQGSAS